MFVEVRPNPGRSFVTVRTQTVKMFKRSFQEFRNFASEEKAERPIIVGVELAGEPFQQEPALVVEAVISRLDEIVAEGLGASPWRPDGASAFSA